MPPKKELVELIIGETKTLGKECTLCLTVKPLNDFPKKSSYLDGHSPWCKECKKEKDRNYYSKNSDKVKVNTNSRYHKKMEDTEFVISERKRSRIKHLTYGKKYNAKQRERYKNDPEYRQKVKEYYREWSSHNKKTIAFKSTRRRFIIKKLPNTLTLIEWKDVLDSFNGACALTNSSKEITIEHFIPVSTGHGGHILGNVYPITKSLNLSKSVHNPFEWVKRGDIKECFDISEWDTLIEYLANQNSLSVIEFENYVNWCFKNKRKPSEISHDKTSLELWRESLINGGD